MTALYLPFVVWLGTFEWSGGIGALFFYPGYGKPWLGVGWTLCFEMLFYTAVAVVLVNPRRLIPVALIAYALCWIARLYVGGPFGFFGNPLILEFLAGAVLAQIRPISKTVGSVSIFCAVGLMTEISLYGIGPANYMPQILSGSGMTLRVATMGLAAVMLVFGVLQVDVKKGALTYLGDASYSIYLTHPIAVIALASTGVLLPVWSFCLIAGALSLMLAIFAFERVERPLVKLARGWVRSRDGLLIAPKDSGLAIRALE